MIQDDGVVVRIVEVPLMTPVLVTQSTLMATSLQKGMSLRFPAPLICT